ncbi:MAG TPA: AMP-binding protein, partial [Mycobacterium sp.]|nr:AMP-binding protein [Mycobacterium sp.]
MTEPAVLAFEERRFSLPELDALVGGWATALTRNGVAAGQRVAVMASNRPEFVAVLLAIWRLGATAVLISPAWKRDEVDHALGLTDPEHAVGDQPVLAGLMPMLHLDEPIAASEPICASPRPLADAVLAFSSGTTGLPKAVRHTHASLDQAVQHWRQALQLT